MTRSPVAVLDAHIAWIARHPAWARGDAMIAKLAAQRAEFLRRWRRM